MKKTVFFPFIEFFGLIKEYVSNPDRRAPTEQYTQDVIIINIIKTRVLPTTCERHHCEAQRRAVIENVIIFRVYPFQHFVTTTAGDTGGNLIRL